MQIRGVKTMDFAGTKEVVYERSDWPTEKLQEYFKNDTLAMIGYGSQGHGQALNARDNGLKVIVGVRKDGASWKEAIEDGWVRSIGLCKYISNERLHTYRSQVRPCSPSTKPSNAEQSS
jgi:Acetohydroxy acid isomeroreductase, NADPH-binding domain